MSSILTADERGDLDALAARMEMTGQIAGEQAKVYAYREIAGLSRDEAAKALDKSKTALDSAHQNAKKRVEGAERLLDIIDEYRGDNWLQTIGGDAETMIDKVVTNTTLGEHQASILVWHHLGEPAEEIGDRLGRRGSYIEGQIRELRRKREEISEEVEELETTKSALEAL